MGRDDVTLKDIALAANTNVCAVSRTLRNHALVKRISSETREKILEAATRLGYQRNLLAYSTRTGIVNTIALMIDYEKYSLSDVHGRIIAGLHTEAAKNDFNVKMFPTDKIENTIREIRGNRIRHVLFLSSDKAARVRTAELCRHYGISLVFVQEKPTLGFPAVNTDNIAAARKAVEYLVLLGHRRIGMIGSSPGSFSYVDDRHDGFIEGLEKSGIEPEKDFILCESDAKTAIGKMIAGRIKKLPTAFFSISDHQMIFMLTCLLRKGLDVPRDVSLLGCGNFLFSMASCPALSSLDMKLHEIGSTAVKLVLGTGNPSPGPEEGLYLLEPEIIVRESTASPGKGIAVPRRINDKTPTEGTPR